MRKKSSGAVWGVMLILFGVFIGGKILHWFDFNIFFPGWWSLFLIIPCSVRLLTESGRRMKALKGLFIGVLFLMAAQGFIEFGMLFPLAVAGFLVMSGLKMLMPKEYFDKTKKNYKREQATKKEAYRGGNYANAADYYNEEYNYYGDALQEEDATSRYRFTAEEEAEFGEFGQKFGWNDYANRGEYRRESTNRSAQTRSTINNRRNGGQCTCTAILCGKEIHFSKEVFDGAMLTAVLGAVDINLRDAVFYHDTVVEAVAVMGSIDILVPKNVHVVVSSTPFLGGIDSHIKRDKPVPPDAVTIYINAKSIMGGIEIK